jgi:8-oxo-dGTP diphosphatase
VQEESIVLFTFQVHDPLRERFLTRESAAGPEVLLGAKKTGFGAGKIVGLGGHVERGECPAQAVVREVAEKSSIWVDS